MLSTNKNDAFKLIRPWCSNIESIVEKSWDFDFEREEILKNL